MSEPYRPHQRAIIFKEDLTSGATLGYHCTIVRVHASSIRRCPDCPDRWVYRVFVPYFNKHLDVASYDLFVTGGVDASDLPPEPKAQRPMCELLFDSDIAEDNEQIEGAYRLPCREWVHFSFRKSDQLVAQYEMRLQVDGFRLGAGKLCYNVPASECLDRRFVLLALAEIVGVKEWHSNW